MKRWVQGMRNGRTIFLAPAVTLALLAGMGMETASTRAVPADAEAYHAAAREAVDSIPTRIGSWSGRREDVPPEAIALLKPNAARCWKFVDNDTVDPRRAQRWASLLVEQCKDARDMSGHWPPNCYVNAGQEMTDAKVRRRAVDGIDMPFTEYHFNQQTATASTTTAVYDFLIVPGRGPGRGILAGMDGLRRAAGDYNQRFYGAAQFQVVMDGELSQPERDQIFQTLMTACAPAIRTLMKP